MKLLSGAIAISALAFSAVPAEAQVQTRDWPSSGFFDVFQFDDACGATSEFEFDGRPNVRFMLRYDGDEVSIGFVSYGWSDIDGQDVETSYHFVSPDKSYSGQAKGFTTDVIYHGFVAPFDPGVLDDFARSRSLIVTRGGDVVTHINLQGSGGATTTLRRCVQHIRAEKERRDRAESRWDYIAPDPFRAEDSDPPARPAVVTNPTWSREVLPDFPERAMSRGIESGSVTLNCGAQSNGSLTDCTILTETPAGVGFGQAALSAAPRARLAPTSISGAADGARVRFTVRFRLEDQFTTGDQRP